VVNQIFQVSAATDATVSVVFSPDEKWVIAASNGDHHQIRSGVRYHVAGRDNSVRVWEVATQRELYRFPMSHGQRYGPQNLSVSVNHSYLAVGAGWWTANGPSEPSIYLFDLSTGQHIKNWFPPGNHAMRAVGFSPDGHVVSCLQSGPGGIHSFSLNETTGPDPRSLMGVGIQSELPRMTWSDDGRWIVGADWSIQGSLLCWDAETGGVKQTFVGHDRPPLQAKISRDGKRVVSVADDHTVRVWNVDSGEPVQVIRQTSAPVQCVAIAPDGHWFATGDDSGTVSIFLTSDSPPLAKETVHFMRVRDLAISSSGRLLASGSDDGSVTIQEVLPPKQRVGN